MADITPAWLSAALSTTGANVEVTRIRAERIGTGQIGLTYRLFVDYASAGQGPKRMIVKLAADDPLKRRAAAFGYQQEVKFYQRVAPTVDVRAPACLHADISADGSCFTLLLEDLEPARPGVQVHGVGPEEAERALRNAAALHAPRWNDPALVQLDVTDWWGANPEDVGRVQVDATEDFIEYLADRLSPVDINTLREAAKDAPRFLTTRVTPATVIHGDYRLDNLLFQPDGPEVIAVDWQTMARGPGARDVAYFLGTSLESAARREHEQSLVKSYHGELIARGVRDYDFEQCFADYRLGQLWAPQIATIGAMSAHDKHASGVADMFAIMAIRSCSAIRDLESFALLP